MKARRSKPKPKGPGPNNPPWRFYGGYLFLMIVLLLVWQETFARLTVQMIPYSEFKTALARGEVKSVSIGKDDITGRIEPKAPPQAP